MLKLSAAIDQFRELLATHDVICLNRQIREQVRPISGDA